MKNQLADIFGKHRTIISTALIGTVLIGGTAFYYKTAFNLTASVTAASCFLTTEIDGKIAEKADLEAQVSSTALAITTTNADITANWQLLIAVNASIAQMSAKVISDYAIGVEKTKVDTVYSQLNDKKALDSLTAQISTAKSALDLTKKASDALSAKLPALKKASDDLNNELASKKELDALLFAEPDSQIFLR
jgi:thiamine pyrophosphate-dependent acetolactate synthase large subunit-like protein